MITWFVIKRRKPPLNEEVLVSDGSYVHEAVRYSHGWTSPDPVGGYESEFDLPSEPVYWAFKPKPPKLNPKDLPSKRKRKPAKPVRRRNAKEISDIQKFAQNDIARMGKQIAKKMGRRSPFFETLQPGILP